MKFLCPIVWATSAEKDLPLICDNYSTHKHPEVQRWLAGQERFHVHFTPTGASWLNMAARFFRDLSKNRLKRGVFPDLQESIMMVESYIDRHDHEPKPFVWAASARHSREGYPRSHRVSSKLKRSRNLSNSAFVRLLSDLRNRREGTTRERRAGGPS